MGELRRELADGEWCGHPGCGHHLSHPCEGCGRVGASWFLTANWHKQEAGRARAGERERWARWHDEQADLALRQATPDQDPGGILLAQEAAREHKRSAQAIRNAGEADND